MGKKIISFSLFGSGRIYLEGAIENIEYAAKYYPGWICRFYTAKNCPAISILNKLNCEVIEMPEWTGIDRTKNDWKWDLAHAGMLWRYFAIDDLAENDCVIFRDCDSRVNQREANCVQKWLDSRYLAHAIYENKTHYNGGWMGGMWGIRSNKIIGVRESITEWIEFYKTVNHDWIFVDLQYNLNVLLPILNPSMMKFGYGTPNPLPELQDGENPIGWVAHENWREQEFNLEQYTKEKNVSL